MNARRLEFVVWAGTKKGGNTRIQGHGYFPLPLRFHDVAHEAALAGADLRRLVRVRVATSAERVAVASAIQRERSERRAVRSCEELWHLSGDRWASVRRRQLGLRGSA